MKKPNFLLVGAPKAGTTSIAKYLGEHPDIFIPKVKEPFYFLPNILKETNKNDPMYDAIKRRAHLTKESYYGLFEVSESEKALGEATVHYLYHFKKVIPRVKEELGDIRIIIILRNPSYRAFSNYKFQITNQLCSFEEALELEEERKQAGYNSFWYYQEEGEYYEPVKAYMENFTEVHIAFFEDLKAQPVTLMQKMFHFLEVKENFIPSVNIKHNKTHIPSNILSRILYYLNRKYKLYRFIPDFLKEHAKFFGLTTSKGRMKENTLLQLKTYYKSDIILLEKLLEKDLSKWYS